MKEARSRYEKYRTLWREVERIEGVTELHAALQRRVEKSYAGERRAFAAHATSFQESFAQHPRIERLFLGKPSKRGGKQEFVILQRQMLHDLQGDFDAMVAERRGGGDRLRLFDRYLRLGVLWRLFRKGALKRREYLPGEEISGQDAEDPRLVFNLDPVDICYYGKRLVAVKEPQMLGEGALWEVPRSCAIRVPEGAKTPCVCLTLDCKRLKRIDADLWHDLLQESFQGFLAKLDRSNERIYALVEDMRSRGISWERMIAVEGEAPLGDTPVETLERSVLLHPSPSTFSRKIFLGYLEQIMKEARFPAGAVIIPLKTVPRRLFVLHRGKAAIRDAHGNTVGYLQPGDVFGESMLVEREAIAEVTALTPVEAIAFERDDLLASPALPTFFMNCIEVLQDKLAASNYRAEGFEKLLADPLRVKALRARYPTDSRSLLRSLARWTRGRSTPPWPSLAPDALNP